MASAEPPPEAPDGEALHLAEPPSVHGVPVSRSRGQLVLHPSRNEYLRVAETLYSEGYTMCVDLCGVDCVLLPDRAVPEGVSPERFEVVVNLRSLWLPRRIRLRVQVPEHDPTCPTLFELHPGTEAMEREAYDMFGIVFVGHPDLSRILMPDDWEGHPLRKDYPVGRVPVQFVGNPQPR